MVTATPSSSLRKFLHLLRHLWQHAPGEPGLHLNTIFSFSSPSYSGCLSLLPDSSALSWPSSLFWFLRLLCLSLCWECPITHLQKIYPQKKTHFPKRLPLFSSLLVIISLSLGISRHCYFFSTVRMRAHTHTSLFSSIPIFKKLTMPRPQCIPPAGIS